MDDELRELSFTVSGRIARPVAEVYEAVADPEQLSRYFTTGAAQGRLEPGTVVTWEFHDFPGAFPVTVVAAVAPQRIALRWAGRATADAAGQNSVTFAFEPIQAGARTRVPITESSWEPTPAGAENAFRSCEGWTGMLAAMKVWLEHGIRLRDGFYV